MIGIAFVGSRRQLKLPKAELRPLYDQTPQAVSPVYERLILHGDGLTFGSTLCDCLQSARGALNALAEQVFRDPVFNQHLVAEVRYMPIRLDINSSRSYLLRYKQKTGGRRLHGY